MNRFFSIPSISSTSFARSFSLRVSAPFSSQCHRKRTHTLNSSSTQNHRQVEHVLFRQKQRASLVSSSKYFSSSSSPSSVTDYLCVHVFVTCKPGTEEAFKMATLQNAIESSKEQGIARFDVIQQCDDPCKFVLVEVYKDSILAPVAHKETKHYQVWRDTVASMMAVPRTAVKYKAIYPSVTVGWDYPSSSSTNPVHL